MAAAPAHGPGGGVAAPDFAQQVVGDLLALAGQSLRASIELHFCHEAAGRPSTVPGRDVWHMAIKQPADRAILVWQLTADASAASRGFEASPDSSATGAPTWRKLLWRLPDTAQSASFVAHWLLQRYLGVATGAVDRETHEEVAVQLVIGEGSGAAVDDALTSFSCFLRSALSWSQQVQSYHLRSVHHNSAQAQRIRDMVTAWRDAP